MQLTLLTPMLLLLTSIHALPKPDDATTSSDSTISSIDSTDHYPNQSQNPVVATVDLWKSGGCQPRICNHNFLVYLNGCSVVPKGCSTSAKITTGSDNCYCKSPSFLFWGIEHRESDDKIKGLTIGQTRSGRMIGVRVSKMLSL
ncbi:hypothetical protein V8E51_014259 [Hyaloscypha variabilis]